MIQPSIIPSLPYTRLFCVSVVSFCCVVVARLFCVSFARLFCKGSENLLIMQIIIFLIALLNLTENTEGGYRGWGTAKAVGVDGFARMGVTPDMIILYDYCCIMAITFVAFEY